MRKNLGPKPYLYPMPVLMIATYDESGTVDVMNAAWGCIADMNRVAIYLAGDHKTTKNILAKKAFTVSMADVAHVVEADYFGVVSANNDSEKFAKSGFHAVKSEFVDAPVIEEFSLALECKMVNFDEESELMIGEIVNVCADEKILDENGKIEVKKLNPITYDPANHGYYTLGEKVGHAFKDGMQLKGK